MARLEDVTRGARVKGILPDRVVTVVDVEWHGACLDPTDVTMVAHLDFAVNAMTELVLVREDTPPHGADR